MERLRANLMMSREDVAKLQLQVLANAGVNLAARPMPCHDPPVAWKAGEWLGVPQIHCPAMKAGEVTLVIPGDEELPYIFDGEPGRRP